MNQSRDPATRQRPPDKESSDAMRNPATRCAVYSGDNKSGHAISSSVGRQKIQLRD
jgi:hypothetical protein